MSALKLSLADGPTEALARAMWRTAQLKLRGLSFEARDTSEIAATTLLGIDVCWSLFVGLVSVEPIRVADTLMQQLLLALRAGEPYRVGRSLAVLSATSRTLGGKRARGAAGLLRRAQAIADTTKHPHLEGLCALSRALASFHEDALERASNEFAHADRVFRESCAQAVWELGTTHFFELACEVARGHTRGLLHHGQRYVEEARMRGDPHTAANVGARLVAPLRLLEGDVDGALKQALESAPSEQDHVNAVQVLCREAALAEVDLYRGEPAAALTRALELSSTLRRSHLGQLQWSRVDGHWLLGRASIAVAAAQSGHGVDLRRAEREARALEREGALGARALAALLHAAIAELQSPETAREAWRAAQDACTESGRELLADLVRAKLAPKAGSLEREQADRSLRARGVRDVDALIRLYLPGRTTSA